MQTVPASQVLQQLAGWLDAFATYVIHLLLPISPSSWLWLADTSLCAWGSTAAGMQTTQPTQGLPALLCTCESLHPWLWFAGC
jgi:hypothetical protein